MYYKNRQVVTCLAALTLIVMIGILVSQLFKVHLMVCLRRTLKFSFFVVVLAEVFDLGVLFVLALHIDFEPALC